MPRLDWYAFYVADYRADTRHLTPMQHFAYREIIDEIFLSGQHHEPPSIPDDDDYLQSIARPSSPEEWAQTRHVLIDGPRALLTVEDGRLYQKRVSHEVRKALERAERGQKGAKVRWAGRAPENAATGSSGNGNGHMSEQQYTWLATRIGKWRIDNAPRFVGLADSSEFYRAFELEIGISWERWQSELSYRRSLPDA